MSRLPALKKVSGFSVGDRIGVLRGSLRGKKGVITKVGDLYLFVNIPGEVGTPIVAMVDVIRLVR